MPISTLPHQLLAEIIWEISVPSMRRELKRYIANVSFVDSLPNFFSDTEANSEEVNIDRSINRAQRGRTCRIEDQSFITRRFTSGGREHVFSAFNNFHTSDHYHRKNLFPVGERVFLHCGLVHHRPPCTQTASQL